MANANNVIPYGNLVHEAALAGGPEAWIDQIERNSKHEGTIFGVAVAVPVTVLGLEGIHYVWRNRRMLKLKAKLAKKRLIEYLSRPEALGTIEDNDE